MKTLATGAALLALGTTSAYAAGLDRSNQGISSIFDADGATSLSFGVVVPKLTGKDISGGGSYDAGVTYSQGSVTFTKDAGEKFNFSVIFDHPYGVDINYDSDPLTTMLGGTKADLNSIAATFVGRYKVSDRISVFAGMGVQRIDASVGLNGQAYAQAISAAGTARTFNGMIAGTGLPPVTAQEVGGAAAAANAGNLAPIAALNTRYAPTGNPAAGNALVTNFANAVTGFNATGGYSFDMDATTEPNYLIGAAYEIEEIGLRVSGTYRFETKHKADTVENVLGTTTNGSVEFVTPRSFNLEAQTGIAEGTLLTASYRWVEYSAVDLVPDFLQSDLVNLDDQERYTLGVARRFSDKLAGSATLIYEPETGDLVSPLGPTNGLKGISLGGRWTDGALQVSGGINYSWLGDATAEVASRPVTDFSDNHALGIGFSAKLTF